VTYVKIDTPPLFRPPDRWHGLLIFGAAIVGICFLLITISNHIAVAEYSRERLYDANNLWAFMRFALLVATGTQVLMGLTFIAWFYISHSQLPALQGRPALPAWTWLALSFIPLVNIVTIPAMLHELWRESDPAPFAGSSRKRTQPTVIYVWWSLGFLVTGCAIYINSFPFNLSNFNHREFAIGMGWIVGLLVVAQQAMYAVMLNSIRELQRERYKMIYNVSPESVLESYRRSTAPTMYRAPSRRGAFLSVVMVILLAISLMNTVVLSIIAFRPSAQPVVNEARELLLRAKQNRPRSGSIILSLAMTLADRQSSGQLPALLLLTSIGSALFAGFSLFAGVTFAIWFCRMHLNLDALNGTPLLPTAAWLVLLCLPVVNLLSIYLMMLDVWLQSDSGRLPGSRDRTRWPLSLTLSCLLGWAAIGVAFVMRDGIVGSTTHQIHTTLSLAYVTWGLIALQQFCSLLTVQSLGRMQIRRHYLVNDSHGRLEWRSNG
jgi:hypothetical protein